MTKSQEFGIERKCVGEGRRRERAGGGSSYTESTGGESAQQERLTTFVLIHNYYRGGGVAAGAGIRIQAPEKGATAWTGGVLQRWTRLAPLSDKQQHTDFDCLALGSPSSQAVEPGQCQHGAWPSTVSTVCC